MDVIESLFHFDPLNVVLLVLGMIGAWYSLRDKVSASTKDIAWHSEWIKKHSVDCDEQRRLNNEILASLRESTMRLTTLTESHHERIARIEGREDRES